MCTGDTDIQALERLLLVVKDFCFDECWCNLYGLSGFTLNIQFVCVCGTEAAYQFRVCLLS